MKYILATTLVIVALASAEPPSRGGILARQQAGEPPYPARGLRPSGPAFNLPLRSQKQQQPPVPAASYGPPTQEYGPPAEATTTETPTTTEAVETTTLEPQAENIRASPTKQKLTNAQQNKPINPASVYVVVPQTQNLVYAQAPSTSGKLVAQIQQPRLVPVQAVPAFARIQQFQPVQAVQQLQPFQAYAKIQEVPYYAQYQAVAAPYTAGPAVSSAYSSVVSTPFSYSFVQNFQ